MKTIDEAMKLLARKVDRPADIKAASWEMNDGMERRRSVANEIGENPAVRDFCLKYIESIGPEIDWNAYALSLNMFINGVLIGMEMERQELPAALSDQNGSKAEGSDTPK